MGAGKVQKETTAGCTASLPHSFPCGPCCLPGCHTGDLGGLLAAWWPQGLVAFVWPLPAVLQPLALHRAGMGMAAARRSGARGVVEQEGALCEERGLHRSDQI